MFFFESDPAENEHGFWDDAHQTCIDASDEVGQATNWMYDTIAERGLPEQAADQVGDFVGGFVEQHWEDVCNLPDTIAESFDDSNQDEE